MLSPIPQDLSKDNSQDNDVVLSVQNVSKKFCRDLKRSMVYGLLDIMSEVTGTRGDHFNLRQNEFLALDNVSLTLRRGESLGLVGSNGSGKTTLLRVITGLIKPDAGQITSNGRVASLIALGAGFNPILTGRENVRVYMSILGVSESEINKRFDDILEFAEIADAIDAPFQTYSSGMAARLGFAAAIHVDPDLLLVDEVLSVGDIHFKAKCQRKISELREQQGVSIVLVSHKSQLVMSVCEKALYLSKGKQIAFGNVNDVIHQYEKDLFQSKQAKVQNSLAMSVSPEDRQLGFGLKQILFKDAEGNIMPTVVSGKPAALCIEFEAYREIQSLNLRVKVKDISGEDDILYLSNWNAEEFFSVKPGVYEMQIKMPMMVLGPGVYGVNLIVRDGSIKTLKLFRDFRFEVTSEQNMSQSNFYQPHDWQLCQIA
jgi:lipopolysaccharide transport system ATP-binding protein